MITSKGQLKKKIIVSMALSLILFKIYQQIILVAPFFLPA
jgi:hypothetical protein